MMHLAIRRGCQWAGTEKGMRMAWLPSFSAYSAANWLNTCRASADLRHDL